MAKISFDYIAAVKKTTDSLECVQVPLHKPKTLIEELKAMIENPNRTLYDLQSKFTNGYRFTKNYWYICYPYSYCASYLNGVRPPKIMSYNDIKKRWNKVYNEKIESIRQNSKANNIVFNFKEAQISANEELDKHKHSEKEDFFNCCYDWINANELQLSSLKLSQQNDILMYSKEDIGFNNFNYTISDDLKISIATNFGFGSAAYFFLSVNYKELAIVPYSFIVRYYKAYMADIVRCTRQYDVRRDSWEAAFDFVVDIANQSQSNPESFIRKYVMNEVKEMMEGLKTILEKPYEAQNELIRTRTPELIVNVRNILDSEQKRLRAYPKETLFIFQVEKITGALHFLQSLRNIANAFVDIEQNINEHIDTLLSYNYQLYPQIQKQFDEITTRIEKGKNCISVKESKVELLKTYLKPYLEKLESLCKDVDSWAHRQKITEDYKKANPEFVRFQNEKQDLENEISEHRNHVIEYENFNAMLKQAMELIDSVREVA